MRTAKIGGASTKLESELSLCLRLARSLRTAKIGGASTKLESELSLCLRLARSLTYWVNEPRGRPRASFLFLTDSSFGNS